jgi:phage-related protein
MVLGDALDFLNSLDTKMRAKAFRTIDLLKTFGPFLTMPHARKIVGTKNLYELRVIQGTNICRLFYFFHKQKTYIILSGFVKKTDKTNRVEINKALRIMEEYLEENNE